MRHIEDILHFLGVEYYEHFVCVSVRCFKMAILIVLDLYRPIDSRSNLLIVTLCTFDWLCMTLLFVIMYGDTIEDTLTSEFLFLVYEYVSLYVVLCAFM